MEEASEQSVYDAHSSEPVDKYIDEMLSKNEIVSFSKSWCPFCSKVERIFEDNGMKLCAVYLDKMGDFGAKIQERLTERTQQQTVPNVFMNGKHIGGCSDVQEAFSNGTIHEMRKNIFNTFEYDLVVLGGGSGGLAAAKEASKYGKKIAVLDYVSPTPMGTTWGLGGTCVNVGCIPKKLMHRAALIHEDIRDAENFGWEVESDVKHNWQKMVEEIQNYIKSLNWNYRKQLVQKGITYLNALGMLKDSHTITVTTKTGKGSVKEITARNIIVAVGGRPYYPDFPGAQEYCITSDDLFSLPNFPGKTLLIGASYISLECAGFLAAMKAPCTVMVRSILLRGFDRGMAERIGKHMEGVGISFLYQCIPIKVSIAHNSTPTAYLVEGRFEDGRTFEDTFNTIIIATGREPCTEGLGLEEVGIELNPKSKKIIIDDFDRTSVKTIFAIGDIADGKPELTPVAIQAGKLIARRIFGSGDTKMDWNYIPTTVFTPLEYGCVGMSEEQAALIYNDQVEVYHSDFQPLEKVLKKDTICYAKLVCVPQEDKELKVVGFHVLAPNAGEITQGFALALKLGATKKQFENLIGIHPTCAEIFTTLTITKSSGLSASAEIAGC